MDVHCFYFYNFCNIINKVGVMNPIISCDCVEDPKDAYEKGEDLFTDDFARACILCDRVMLPDEFAEYQEEHDYEIKNT